MNFIVATNTIQYKYNPYYALLVTSLCFVLSYVAVLGKTLTPPLDAKLAHKLANHGVQWLLPIALPMGRQQSNPVHPPHLHTDLGVAYVQGE